MNAIRREIKRLKTQRLKFLALATKLGYSFTHKYTNSACIIHLRKCDWARFLKDDQLAELYASDFSNVGSGEGYYILSIHL